MNINKVLSGVAMAVAVAFVVDVKYDVSSFWVAKIKGTMPNDVLREEMEKLCLDKKAEYDDLHKLNETLNPALALEYIGKREYAGAFALSLAPHSARHFIDSSNSQSTKDKLGETFKRLDKPGNLPKVININNRKFTLNEYYKTYGVGFEPITKLELKDVLRPLSF